MDENCYFVQNRRLDVFQLKAQGGRPVGAEYKRLLVLCDYDANQKKVFVMRWGEAEEIKNSLWFKRNYSDLSGLTKRLGGDVYCHEFTPKCLVNLPLLNSLLFKTGGLPFDMFCKLRL